MGGFKVRSTPSARNVARGTNHMIVLTFIAAKPTSDEVAVQGRLVRQFGDNVWSAAGLQEV
ncbi:MAG: hypothetical protein DMG96_34590 [Acidobacteria bacterium]|nr:MAG: hypothetical protein DMG96_34590 [Acidobacteriota bacterium]